MRLWIRLIPPFLVRHFARPYVAGDSLDRAMSVAQELWARRGLATTLDLLAEDIDSEAQVRANIDTYLRMVQAAADAPGFPTALDRPTLSLKLSSYTTRPLHEDGDGDGAYAAAARICTAARERGVRVTVDMEGSPWTDFTLETVRRLRAEVHREVGAVLQTRLHRTRDDIEHLPQACHVRLVIGIYQEEPAIALVDKPAMKQRMIEYGGLLLQRGHYVEFATHDEAAVRSFVDEVAPRCGAGPDRYEVQMLYGVPRDRLLSELRHRGVRCRLYVPFALGWAQAIQYLRRRLDEYPAMMWLVARNMWRRG